MLTGSRYDSVIAAIDAANAADPNSIEIEGKPQPTELVYGRRIDRTCAARVRSSISQPTA